MNVLTTENRLNEKWVLLAGKLLPGLALVLLFLMLPAAASAQFTCPAHDQAGFALGQSNTTTNPIFCSYPAVPGEDPNDFFCTYSKTTGTLVTDNDAGFCPANAPGTPPPGSASLSVMKTHVGTFTQGGAGEWDISVSNGAGATTTSGTTTVSDTLPSGYTVNSFTGTDVSWTCMGTGTQTATCTSTAAISGGSSFMPVKITVNIPAASPTSVTNTGKAFGGGDTTHTSLATAASGSDTVSVVQAPATITATAGTPQNTNTNTPFPVNLQATVKDANSVGVPNVNVTFQAPNTGQSGTFGAPCSGTTCVVVTNAQGVANAPTFTANNTPGSYTVAATAPGVNTPANFQLTNNAPPMPPSFTKTITTPFGVINQGDVAQVTFTITNPNASSLTGLAFTDVLPAGFQVQNSPVSNTCGGTATADPGTNTISLTGGTLAGSSQCTITANVVGIQPGPLTNPSVMLASSTGPATAAAVTVYVYPWWLVFFY